MEGTYTAERLYDGLTCNNCGYEFTKDELQEAIEDVCQEPFNGIVLSCPGTDSAGDHCGAEYSLDIRISVSEL